MRLFVALDFPPSLREALAPLFREKIPGAKWTSPEQLHLTLRFLGECPDETFEALRSGLREIAAPSFPLALQGVGTFPNPQRPRVLWAGLEAGPELYALQNQVEALAQALGLPPETKAFSPHLTLARLKFPAPAETARFLMKFHGLRGPAFRVEEFHLYSSRLSPKAAEHRKEASFPLRQGSSP